MRMSRYFLPALKETPAEAELVSHRLMLRAGLVRQASAGIYVWLPMGYRVLKRIEQIVREEQDAAGAQEVLMPTIQQASLWRKSGRYEDYGAEMLRVEDRHGRGMLYGPTNEEQITEVMAQGLRSYRQLPMNLYHVQWKFRDELRPRHGVMRGREFLMKDAYSFDLSEEEAIKSYARMFVAYVRTYARMGVQALPMAADAGAIGGDMSHEFIILAEGGESEVWYDGRLLEMGVPSREVYGEEDMRGHMEQWTSYYAATSERHDAERFQREVPEEWQRHGRGIEVGHIFYFGAKYSRPLGLKVAGEDGVEREVLGGSYGIGVSRLVGGLIEASHDDKGIIWHPSVAPFQVGLVGLRGAEDYAEKVYLAMEERGIEVLYNDTREGAGEKFAVMDLLGLPWQVVVGPRGAEKKMVEVRWRGGGEQEMLTVEAAMERICG